MEYFAVVSTITDWVFRGYVNGEFVVSPTAEFCKQAVDNNWEVRGDSYWNVNQVGASANSNQYTIDQQLTLGIIKKEISQYG